MKAESYQKQDSDLLSFRDMRRVVKLYTALLDDPDCQHISKANAKVAAKAYVRVSLKYPEK